MNDTIFTGRGKNMPMNFKIDKNRIRSAFHSYTEQYDLSDKKVELKIDHTYRVADLCERIAQEEMLPEQDVRLAWLLGMLHDVGRFEQLRQYGTFMDAESVNHAELGADILFREGKIRDYVTDEGEDIFIEMAVRVHNAYRLPESLNGRSKKLCDILRDADKIDILKVNAEIPAEEIYGVATEILKHSEVSEEVVKSFYEHRAVLGKLKKTAIDYVVGIASLAYELVFPVSRRIAADQGNLWKILHFDSENLKTKEQFAGMLADMRGYLQQFASDETNEISSFRER